MDLAAKNLSNINNNTSTLDDIVIVPAGKLDADEYNANDIDGVTESLFGSGNMGYASLQASQTDALLKDSASINSNNDDFSLDATTDNAIGNAGSGGYVDNAASSEGIIDKTLGGAFDIGKNADASQNSNNETSNNNESSSNMALSSEIAQIASDAGGFGGSNAGADFEDGEVGAGESSSANLSSNSTNNNINNAGNSTANFGLNNSSNLQPRVIQGSDGLDGSDGFDSVIGRDGASGNNGENGADGESAGDSITIINEGDNVTNTLIDIEQLGDVVNNILMDLADNLGDNITSITNISQTLTGIVNHIDLDSVVNLGGVTNLVTDIVEELGDVVGDTISIIENVTDSITNILNNLLLSGQGLNINVNLPPIIGVQVALPLQNLLNSSLDIKVDIASITDILNGFPTLEGAGLVHHLLDNVADVASDLQAKLGDISEIIGDVASVDELMCAVDNVGAVTHLLSQTLTDILDNVSNVGDLTDGLLCGEIPILGDGGLPDAGGIIENVLDLAGGLTGGLLGDVLGLGGDNIGGTDGDLDIVGDIEGLDIPIVEAVTQGILDPVEDLLGDVDIGLGVATDLFGNSNIDNNAGDSDLVINTNIELIDNALLGGGVQVPLDGVEAIIGDIDLNVGAALDLLGNQAQPLINDGVGGTGENNLLNQLGETLSDVADSILTPLGGANASLIAIGGDGNSDNAAGDTDLVVDLNVGIAGVELVDLDVDIPLDIVENITGDIDINLGGAITLLENNNAGGGLLSNIGNIANNSGWTENIIVDGGGLFGDLAGGNIAANAAALPDPVGTVAEGLGALNILPNQGLSLGGGGGLFG
jgi:hypothetical protein